jgi:hypothetical protein
VNNIFAHSLSELNEKYVIIRPASNVLASSEIDIWCDNPDRFFLEIREILSRRNPDFTFRSASGSSNGPPHGLHMHIDVCLEGKFIFRYDVLNKKALCMHNCLKQTAIPEMQKISNLENVDGLKLNFLTTDALVKILVSEFVSYYVNYPSKYKHWEYLTEIVECEHELFKVLHNDIDLDLLEKRQSFQWRKRVVTGLVPKQIRFLWDLARKLNELGMRDFMKKVFEKFVK